RPLAYRAARQLPAGPGERRAERAGSGRAREGARERGRAPLPGVPASPSGAHGQPLARSRGTDECGRIPACHRPAHQRARHRVGSRAPELRRAPQGSAAARDALHLRAVPAQFRRLRRRPPPARLSYARAAPRWLAADGGGEGRTASRRRIALCLLGGLSAHAASPVWAIRGAHNTVYLAGSVLLVPAEDAVLPQGFEQQLVRRTHADGKPTAGLETLGEEPGSLEALASEDQMRFLDQTVSELKRSQQELEEVLHTWRRGDAATHSRLLAREIRSF